MNDKVPPALEQRATYGEVRQDWLDWLRAVAILLVLSSHYQLNWRDAGLFKPLAQFNMRVGWSGVDLFFVISGFLIGGLLLNEVRTRNTIDLFRFYVRRILKIWPLLYVLPIIWFFFEMAVGRIDFNGLMSFWPVYLHIQNYYPTPLGHLWSLAVEEHFYLILPVVVGLSSIRDWRSKRLPLFCLSAMLIICAIRCYAVFFDNFPVKEVRPLTQFRLDSLAFGVLLSWISIARPFLWLRLQSKPFVLISFALFFAWPFLLNPNFSRLSAGLGFTSLYISYGCLLILTSSATSLLQDRQYPRVALNCLAWIGRYSFPIYLFHPLVWLLFAHGGFNPSDSPPTLFGSLTLTWIAGFVAFLSLSIGLGSLVAELVEKPLLILRNRLVPPRATALRGMPLPDILPNPGEPSDLADISLPQLGDR